MARLTYPTECGTAAIMPPLTDVQRRMAALREMDADVHAALVRDLIVHRQHEFDQRAAEALYSATEAKPNAEQAFAMAVASSVRGDDLGVVGAHFRQWVLLAQGHLVSDLVDLCDDGQRVTFGRTNDDRRHLDPVRPLSDCPARRRHDGALLERRMTTKHTPGPWTHHPEDNIILDASGRRLIEWQARSVSVSVEERDANGRLIAAAPAMYAFIEKRAAQGDQEAIQILGGIHANS